MITNAERIAFLASLHEFHYSAGYDDGEDGTLQVVLGNVNDRRYEEIGTGDTFVAALDDAIARQADRAKTKL